MNQIIITKSGEELRLVPRADGAGATLHVLAHACNTREIGGRTVTEISLGLREITALMGQSALAAGLEIQARVLNPGAAEQERQAEEANRATVASILRRRTDQIDRPLPDGHYFLGTEGYTAAEVNELELEAIAERIRLGDAK